MILTVIYGQIPSKLNFFFVKCQMTRTVKILKKLWQLKPKFNLYSVKIFIVNTKWYN